MKLLKEIKELILGLAPIWLPLVAIAIANQISLALGLGLID